jgi:DNA-binding SARP family transcriptional activator
MEDAAYRLRLLGSPVLEGPAGPVHLGGTKAHAVLLYLAAEPEARAPRQRLADLLWADCPAETRLATMDKALWRLRRALPCWPLEAQGGRLGWGVGVPVEVDTSVLADALRRDSPEALKRAIALWRGPFLSGAELEAGRAYRNWLVGQREIWRQRIGEALDRVATRLRLAGAWADLASHARRAVAVDPSQERFQLWLEEAQAGLRGAQASPRRPRPTPLVGRTGDVARVVAAIRGGARCVFVYGEDGVGKSSVVDDALRVEDIHAAGAEALAGVVRRARAASGDEPVQVVTACAGDLGLAARGLLRRLECEGRLAWIDLGPLPAAALGELARRHGGQGPDLAAGLLDRTGGNPALAVALIEAVAAAHPAGWTAAAAAAEPVPAAVRARVVHRMSVLSDPARRLAQAAAALGSGVPFAGAARAADLGAGDALAGLDQLLECRWLRELDAGAGQPPRLAFAHGLVAQALLNGMSAARRAHLLRRAPSARPG